MARLGKMEMEMTNAEMKQGRYARLALARKKLTFINAALARGESVYLSTYTRNTRYTAKHAGMFKATKTGLYVQSGKGWLCADGCKITAA